MYCTHCCTSSGAAVAGLCHQLHLHRKNICENRARPELNCNDVTWQNKSPDLLRILTNNRCWKLSIIFGNIHSGRHLNGGDSDFKAGADDPYVSDASLYQYLAVSGIFRRHSLHSSSACSRNEISCTKLIIGTIP
jgi:hypothetical protein